jgi:hypothetical protein
MDALPPRPPMSATDPRRRWPVYVEGMVIPPGWKLSHRGRDLVGHLEPIPDPEDEQKTPEDFKPVHGVNHMGVRRPPTP